MTGKIEHLDEWTYENADSVLQEAGLRVDKENKNIYVCEEADALEVICVIETHYGVLFNKSEHARLARLMKRGFIGRPCFLSWLKRCNSKPVRAKKKVQINEFDFELNKIGIA